MILQMQASQAELEAINKVIVYIKVRNEYAEPIEIQTWSEVPTVPGSWQVPPTNLAGPINDVRYLFMEE